MRCKTQQADKYFYKKKKIHVFRTFEIFFNFSLYFVLHHIEQYILTCILLCITKI